MELARRSRADSEYPVDMVRSSTEEVCFRNTFLGLPLDSFLEGDNLTTASSLQLARDIAGNCGNVIRGRDL
jgi:hypothetical protein